MLGCSWSHPCPSALGMLQAWLQGQQGDLACGSIQEDPAIGTPRLLADQDIPAPLGHTGLVDMLRQLRPRPCLVGRKAKCEDWRQPAPLSIFRTCQQDGGSSFLRGVLTLDALPPCRPHSRPCLGAQGQHLAGFLAWGGKPRTLRREGRSTQDL